MFQYCFLGKITSTLHIENSGAYNYILYSNSKKDVLNSTLSENIYYICSDILITRKV